MLVLLPFVVVFFCSTLLAQHQLATVVVDSVKNTPLAGVNVVVAGTILGGVTDSNGTVVISRLPTGTQTIVFSLLGYKSRSVSVSIPFSAKAMQYEIKLVPTEIQLGSVTVTSTRTSYHVDDAPIRIEVKGEEDIGETMIDHPSSISELFLESTGIQVLQTSPVSNYVSIKLQGLDGSYTQILKDGFPLYGGLSAGLSVTQIPPLDLSRVEIIKGPSSALYGSGAMAGIIDLISKQPTTSSKFTFLLNGTSSKGGDGGLFTSGQWGNLGYTMLVNGTSQEAYDADGSGFSDLPRQEMFTVNPRVTFDAGDDTRVSLGVSTTSENLWAGDMTAIKNGRSPLHPYEEVTRSNRSYTQFEIHTALASTQLDFKNSFGSFYLDKALMELHFKGTQWSSYSELTAQIKSGVHTLTGGVNLTTDNFDEEASASGIDRSYAQAIGGIFGQDDWQIGPRVTLETGLRVDRERQTGWQVIPRIGGRYQINPQVAVRISGGLGYKLPNLFSDETDPNLLFTLRPLQNGLNVERSAGGECDVTWNTIAFGSLTIALDQAAFFTRIVDPLVIHSEAASTSAIDTVALTNANGSLSSEGAETDVRLTYGDWEAFLGYTYTNARSKFPDKVAQLYSTPVHRFVMDIVADLEDLGEAGIEYRFTGPQLLHDGSTSPGYSIVDVLFQRPIGHLTFFIGVENAFNFMESRYTPVVFNTPANPQFNDVWAPLEGRIVNAGLKFHI
jgi:outer membrane receptor for ferrienterochelin and colicins